MALQLLDFAPEHAEGVVAVVRAVHDEYGFTWEADGYHADLYDVEGRYRACGGMFQVLVDEGRVVGTVGVAPHGADECELHRMYLLKEYRGRRLGQRLLDAALRWAKDRGMRRMVLWSDVKLPHAHALYRANEFIPCGERICDDPDRSHEYGFRREPI
jgi:GNAT superfamily N-acetyltransferase